LARARHTLNNLATTIQFVGVADDDRRYNLAWMDRLNLENLILVSRAICVAASAREDSRGAHFREDHPAASDLAPSRYTVLRAGEDERLTVTMAPVHFTRVAPGDSLLAAAE
jgi:fumarate reductase flavoprotein subunit